MGNRYPHRPVINTPASLHMRAHDDGAGGGGRADDMHGFKRLAKKHRPLRHGLFGCLNKKQKKSAMADRARPGGLSGVKGYQESTVTKSGSTPATRTRRRADALRTLAHPHQAARSVQVRVMSA